MVDPASSAENCHDDEVQIIPATVTTASVSSSISSIFTVTQATPQDELSSNRTILDALKAPAKSILGGKREVKVNKFAVRRKKRSSANTRSAPKSIPPTERLAGFPNQHFKISKSVLF